MTIDDKDKPLLEKLLSKPEIANVKQLGISSQAGYRPEGSTTIS